MGSSIVYESELIYNLALSEISDNGYILIVSQIGTF